MKSLLVGLTSVGIFLLALSSIEIGAQPSTLWAIVATVSVPDHEPIPYQAKMFATEAECEAFLITPEMDEAVAALTEYEREGHNDKSVTVKVECALIGHR